MKEFIAAAKAASSPLKMGGTGSKREDNVLTVFVEQKTGAKFSYLPYKSGGEAATQLVGGHTESNVNNPSENLEVLARRLGAAALRVRQGSASPYETCTTCKEEEARRDGGIQGLHGEAGAEADLPHRQGHAAVPRRGRPAQHIADDGSRICREVIDG